MLLATELMLNVPKVIQLMIYIVVAIIIFRRSDYILNRTLTVAFIGWMVYIGMDIIFFTYGALVNPFGLVTAASAPIPLLIINVLRDIAMIGGPIFGFGMLFAALFVRYGEKKVKDSKAQVIIIFIVAVICIILNVVLDSIVYNAAPLVGVNTDIGVGAIVIVLMIIIYLIGLGYFISTYFESSPEGKRKILFFIVGLLIIPAVMIFWVVMSFVPDVLIQMDAFYLTYQSIGHLLWATAPIFIYLGIRQED